MIPTMIASRAPLRRVGRLAIGVLAVASMLVQTVSISYAQSIVADPSAGGQLGISQAPNGVPLVNIATPNHKGLSHNTYTQFDVGTPGAILNNSTALGQSTLGGLVMGNPNLGGTPARIILNEVTSTNHSTLGGMIEVNGGPAAVVIANPNGITCNGCGFINTPRATLTTGTPVINGGELTGLSVNAGVIDIGAGGLDARNTSYFDIVSRAAILNGAIHGQDVGIYAGRNDFDYINRQITAIKPDDGSAKPTISIDSSALGGMYANRISLESTEAGVGVKAPTGLVAGSGGMTLTANGKLVIKSASSAGDVRVRSNTGGVATSGTLYAGGDLSVSAEGDIDLNNSILSAFGDVSLGGHAIALTDTALIAGINAQGALQARAGVVRIEVRDGFADDADSLIRGGAAVSLKADDITLAGQTISDGAIDLAAATTLTTSSGQVLSGITGVSVSSGHDMILAGEMVSKDSIQIAVGGSLDIAATAQFQATSDVAFASQGDMVVDGLVLAGDTLTLTSSAGGITTGANSILNAIGTITIDGAGSLALAGNIVSRDATLALSSGTRTTIAGTSVIGANAIDVASQDDIDLGGRMVSEGGLTLTSSYGAVNVASGGIIGAKADVHVQSGGDIALAGNTQLVSEGLIDLSADGNVSVDGLVQSNRTAVITAGGAISSGSDSRIDTAGDLMLTAGGNLVADGVAVAGGTIAGTSNSGMISVGQTGILSAEGELSLESAGDMIVAGTVASSSGGTTLTSGAGFTAAGSSAIGGKNIAVAAGADITAAGQMVSDGPIDLTADLGNIRLLGSSNLGARGDILVRAGKEIALGQSGRLISQSRIKASAGTGLFIDGIIQSDGLLELEAAGKFEAGDQSRLDTLDNLRLRAAGVALGGITVAGRQMSVDSSSSDFSTRQDSVLSADDGIALSSAGDMALAGIITSANGAVSLASASQLTTRTTSAISGAGLEAIGRDGVEIDGRLISTLDMELASAEGAIVVNAGAVAVSKGLLSVDGLTGATLDGRLHSDSDVTVDARSGTLTIGGAITGDNISLVIAGGLVVAGAVEAGNILSVNAGQSALIGGSLRAGGDASIEAQALSLGSDGQISAGGNLAIASAELLLANGLIAAGVGQNGAFGSTGVLDIETARIAAGSGILAAAGGVLVQSNGNLSLEGGVIRSAGQVAIDAAGTLDASAGIEAGTTLALSGRALTNSGALAALGDISLLASGAALSNSASITSGGSIELGGQSIVNQGALEAASDIALMASGGSVSSVGSLIGNRNLSVTAPGTVSLLGAVQAGGDISVSTTADLSVGVGKSWISGRDLTLQARNLTNNGAIGAGRDLSILLSGNLTNIDLIAAKRNASIRLDGALDNTGTVIAANDLTIAGLSGAKAASVTNTNGLVEAIQGHLSIATGSLTNRTTGISVVTDETPGGSHSEYVDGWCAEMFGHSNKECGGTTSTTDTRILTERSVGDLNRARLLAGSGMTIAGGSIVNEYALIAANGDITLTGTSLTNTARDLIQSTEETVSGTVHFYACTLLCSKDPVIVIPLAPTTTTSSATIGSIYSTIQATGTLTGSFTGQIDNVTIRQAANQVGLSSGTGVQGPLAATVTFNTSGGVGGIAGQVAAATPGQISGGASASGSGGLGSLDLDVGHIQPVAVSAVGSNAGAISPVLSLESYLSGSSLTQVVPEPSAKYLIETRSEFVVLSNFYNSDYFFERLEGYDPERLQKRLGDAYVESRLIEDQILALTGKRFLSNGDNAYDQIAALHDNALDTAIALGLQSGISLTDEQIAALTHDIVWYETAVVDGQSVLIPRVYLAGPSRAEQNGGAQLLGNEVVLASSGLTNSGAIVGTNGVQIATLDNLSNLGGLIEGGGVDLKVGGQLLNLSGIIAGDDIAIEAKELINQTAVTRDTYDSGFADRTQQIARIDGTGRVDITTLGDLVNRGGTMGAGDALSISAGGSVDISALALESQSEVDFHGGFDRFDEISNKLAGLSAGTDLTIEAGRDVTLSGAELSAGGDLNLAADGNVVIGAVQDSGSSASELHTQSGGLFGGSRDYAATSSSQETIGSNLDAVGNLNITSGGDTSIVASTLAAGDDLGIDAGGNLTVGGALDASQSSESKHRDGFFSSSSSDQAISTQDYAGSLLIAGGNATLDAGGDIGVIGSAIIGGGNVSLDATNVTLGAAQTVDSQSSASASSGLFADIGNGGFSIGWRDQKDNAAQTVGTSIVSTISAGSDLAINADQDIVSQGGVISAGEDLSLQAGNDVRLDAVTDTMQTSQNHELSEIGLTVGVKENVTGNLETLAGLPEAMDMGKGSGFNKAVTAASAALEAVDAANSLMNGNLASAEISLGIRNEQSSSSQAVTVESGGTLQAGGDISIVAGRDITAEGTQIIADDDITLDAGRDITLTASQNADASSSQSSSSSLGISVSAGIGLSGANVGVGISASGQQASGSAESVTHNNALVSAGGDVDIASGRDTTLSGAVVEGDTVAADIGGDLTIESLQDTSNRDSSSIGGSVGITIGAGGVGVNGGINGGQGQGSSAWVNEQSGIYAEDQADIRVEGNTHLEGGIIDAGAGNVTLDTGTLTFADIHDHDESSDTNGGINVNIGVASGGQLGQPGGSVDFTQAEIDREQETRATVGAGDIIIRDTEAQQALEDAGETGDVANLNRDPDLAQEITKDEESYIGVYASDTSVATAARAGATILNAIGEVVENLVRSGAITPDDALSIDALVSYRDDPEVRLQLEACVNGQQASRDFDLFNLVITPAYAATMCTVQTPDGLYSMTPGGAKNCLEIYDDAGALVKNGIGSIAGVAGTTILAYLAMTIPAGGGEYEETSTYPDGTIVVLKASPDEMSYEIEITSLDGFTYSFLYWPTGDGAIEIYDGTVDGHPLSPTEMDIMAGRLSHQTGVEIVNSYIPNPKEVPSWIPGGERVRPKTPVQGGGKLRARWKDEDGNIYEWDTRHGAVEKYNPRGRHLGEFDAETGEQTKPADDTRNVEP